MGKGVTHEVTCFAGAETGQGPELRAAGGGQHRVELEVRRSRCDYDRFAGAVDESSSQVLMRHCVHYRCLGPRYPFRQPTAAGCSHRSP